MKILTSLCLGVLLGSMFLPCQVLGVPRLELRAAPPEGWGSAPDNGRDESVCLLRQQIKVTVHDASIAAPRG